METRKLHAIVWREDLYPRQKPDAGLIQRYAEDLSVLPPIEVNQDNILIDGYHRWQAYQQAGAETLPVIVTVTPDEAELLRLAIMRNATHGRQLATADKRRYAQLWAAELPAAQICATLSISERTLRRWTQDRRAQQAADLDTEILTRWLRCESQAAIAAAVGMDDAKVSRLIADFSQNGQLSDLRIFCDFSPELTTVWRFAPPAPDAPATQVAPALVDNLLYYYTQPGDVVFDPFADNGVTLTVCQQRQRRCYASAGTPPGPDIRHWDITADLPEDLPVPDLVFLAPPDWPAEAGDSLADAPFPLTALLKNLGDLGDRPGGHRGRGGGSDPGVPGCAARQRGAEPFPAR